MEYSTIKHLCIGASLFSICTLSVLQLTKVTRNPDIMNSAPAGESSHSDGNAYSSGSTETATSDTTANAQQAIIAQLAQNVATTQATVDNLSAQITTIHTTYNSMLQRIDAKRAEKSLDGYAVTYERYTREKFKQALTVIMSESLDEIVISTQNMPDITLSNLLDIAINIWYIKDKIQTAQVINELIQTNAQRYAPAMTALQKAQKLADLTAQLTTATKARDAAQQALQKAQQI